MKVFDPVAHAKQKERILKIALRLFATQGFVETSMLQIAKASKLQKATLYHYFFEQRSNFEVFGAMALGTN